jgi:hypothetical protein
MKKLTDSERLSLTEEQKTEYYLQQRKKLAIEEQQRKFKEEQAVLDAAYDDTDPDAAKTGWQEVTPEEAKKDWNELKRIARMQFPEGAKHMGLNPLNRLCAIARCLGWPLKKISQVSNVKEATLYGWFRRPDIILFMDEFNLKQGQGDIMDKFNGLKYKAVCFVQQLLDDPSSEDSVRRLKMDAAKWVFDRSMGKPNQPIEHRGDVIRGVVKQLQGMQMDLSAEDEEKLFKVEDAN